MAVHVQFKRRILWWGIGSLGCLGLALMALLVLLVIVILGMFASSTDSTMDQITGPDLEWETWDIPPALLPLYLRNAHTQVSWARLAAIQRMTNNFGLEERDIGSTIGIFAFPLSLWKAYQRDGDEDGHIDPDNPADVIASLANVFRFMPDENNEVLMQLFPNPTDIQRVLEKEREYAAWLVFQGPWLWPIVGYWTISSDYGGRADPVTGEGGVFHDGVDIPAPRGTPVLATQDGTVIQVINSSSGYGNLIRLQHSNGVVSFYGHLTDIGVRMGQYVHRGEVIGWIGNTGKSTGPHLHFGMAQNGQSVNPRYYIHPRLEEGP